MENSFDIRGSKACNNMIGIMSCHNIDSINSCLERSYSNLDLTEYANENADCDLLNTENDPSQDSSISTEEFSNFNVNRTNIRADHLRTPFVNNVSGYEEVTRDSNDNDIFLTKFKEKCPKFCKDGNNYDSSRVVEEMNIAQKTPVIYSYSNQVDLCYPHDSETSFMVQREIRTCRNISIMTSESNLNSFDDVENDSNSAQKTVCSDEGFCRRDGKEFKSVTFHDTLKTNKIEGCQQVNNILHKPIIQNMDSSKNQNSSFETEKVQNSNLLEKEIIRCHKEVNLDNNGDASASKSMDEIESDESEKWEELGYYVQYNTSNFFSCDKPVKPKFDSGFNDKSHKKSSQDSPVNNAPIKTRAVSNKIKVLVSRDESHLTLEDESSSIRDEEDSELSLGTSHSASSAFESAMSSNDMMSPFSTPRNTSIVNNLLDPRYRNGINFASLTSENIPNTLCRITAHKGIENNVLDKHVLALDMESNTENNKSRSIHKIRKLLNLTALKKNKKDEIDNKTVREREKIVEHKAFKNKPFVKSKSYFQNTMKNDSQTYKSSKKQKPEEPRKTNFNRESNFVVNSKHGVSCPNNISVISDTTPTNVKSTVDFEPAGNLSLQSKKKFLSKIPRLISSKGFRERKKGSVWDSSQENESTSNGDDASKTILKKNHPNVKSFMEKQPVKNDRINDKNSIIVSEMTTNLVNTCAINTFDPFSDQQTKAERTMSYKSCLKNCDWKSDKDLKRNINSSQINNLRSKFWGRENKSLISPFKLPKTSESNILPKIDESLKNDKQLKGKSTPSYGTTYRKMIRVTTAPHSFVKQQNEKPTNSPSRPLSARKSTQKTSKTTISCLESRKYF